MIKEYDINHRASKTATNNNKFISKEANMKDKILSMLNMMIRTLRNLAKVLLTSLFIEFVC